MQKTGILAGEAYIPKNTQLTVELTKELSSKTNRKGESTQFKLVDNMILNDVVVIPAGTKISSAPSMGQNELGLDRYRSADLH